MRGEKPSSSETSLFSSQELFTALSMVCSAPTHSTAGSSYPSQGPWTFTRSSGSPVGTGCLAAFDNLEGQWSRCSSRSFATFRSLVHFAPPPITPFLVCKLEFLLHEAVSPLSHVLNPPSDCVQAPGYHVFLEEIQPCPIPCILQALLNYIIISLYSPIS